MTLLDCPMGNYFVHGAAAGLVTAPHGGRSGLVFLGSGRSASGPPADGTPAPALP